MRSRSVLSVCAFLMCCSVANADPITVTGGSIVVMGNTGGIAFSLFGDGLALHAIADSDSRVDPRFCSPCTATQALTNVTYRYVELLANFGLEGACRKQPTLIGGINTRDGRLTCKAVAEAHGLKLEPPF